MATPTFGTGSLTFGTPTQSTLNFGATTAQPTLGFGTPATTSTVPSFGFGTATPTFGTPATSQPLGFGTATQPQFGFGTQQQSTSSGLFGQTQTKPLFGGTTTATTSASSFGPTPSFGFGTTMTTSAPSFGLTQTTTTTGFSLGGLTPATAASTISLTTETPAPFVGLGGTAPTLKTSTTEKEIPPREQTLPPEILQTVEQFKKTQQEQKVLCSEVARSSIKEFRDVEQALNDIYVEFDKLETRLLSERNVVNKLKCDTAKGLENIEMAQRTQNTPQALQYENTAPLRYFLELTDRFERDMMVLKTKIDTTANYINKFREPTSLTSEEFSDALKKLHSTVVALSGRLYTLHNHVETQKEYYLAWRRQFSKSDENPFERSGSKRSRAMETIISNVLKSNQVLDSVVGPSPFSSIGMGSNNPSFSQENQQIAPQSSFSISTFLNPPSTDTLSTGFQLQKPPTGNKRGKQ